MKWPQIREILSDAKLWNELSLVKDAKKQGKNFRYLQKIFLKKDT